MPYVEQSWPGDAANVGEARRFVCRTLAAWGADSLEWPAAALVSELATNAVLHAGTTFVVRLTLEDDRLRLEVKDNSPVAPVVRHYGDESTTGRGMRLVVELSETWGVEPHRKSKSVWCVLIATPGPEVADDDVDVDALLAQFDDGSADAPVEQAAREHASDHCAA